MHRWLRFGCLCLAASICQMVLAYADEPAAEKKAEKPAAAAPAAHTVAKVPLKITAELDGVIEGETAREIILSPEEWPSLTVQSAAAHGATVHEGDVILQMETEKIDRAIADLVAELKISDVSLHQSAEQLQALEKTTAWDLEAGQRAARVAEEDQKYYIEIERPFTLKSAEYTLKANKDALEYAEEELSQLEKMYKADDITEESEEIVLKRGRNALEGAKFAMISAQLTYNHTMKYAIPRRDEQTNESLRRSLLAWEKSKVDLPMALQRQRLEVERLRMQHSQSEGRLKRMQADREAMTIKSPTDGIVFYGRWVNGRPADSNAFADALRPHGTIQGHQLVVMTVVQPRPVHIRATAPESLLADLQIGLKGTAVPTGYPDMKVSAIVDRVSDIPVSPGVFDARLRVELKGKTKGLAPGMTCKVKFVTYLKKDAICVPPSTIINDELDEQKQSVKVLEKDGKTAVRPVTVGRKTDKQVEILSGLSEGEQVLLEPSKEQK
jgi:HlyD family secretion protein